MLLRKSVAATMIAGAAIFALAGCSDEQTDNAKSAASSVVDKAGSKASSLVQSVSKEIAEAVPGLSKSKAQTTLDTALNPNTPAADLDAVVDTTNPATKAALQGFSKAAAEYNYTFTVTDVAKTADANKADVKIAVKAPTIPMPDGAPMTLSFVKVDGSWKLSGDAVTQLAATAGGHGH